MSSAESPLSSSPETHSLRPMLERMSQLKASDLFLCEARVPAVRVNGQVARLSAGAMTRPALRQFMELVLRPPQLARFDAEGDLDVGFSDETLGRFRANFHLQRGLLSAVIRQVPSGQLAFDVLDLPPVIKTLAEERRGLILVSGNTGSGKSTTLAAILHHINATYHRHIITVEDPIEFVHDDMKSIVTQREVGNDTRDFITALRNVVRESPDVILIGEMRDAETLNIALSAAMTGHLVLSTVHAIDASQTLQRILGFYPEQHRAQIGLDLSLCLQGVVCQRLVPRDDQAGRIVAAEILLATPTVRKLIREQRLEDLPDLLATTDAMQSFNRSLVSLYEKKVISLETGAAYATNSDEFRLNALGLERGSASFMTEHDQLPSVGTVDMKTLLQVALHYGASDVHLNVGTPPMFRVNGKLNPLGKEKLSHTDVRRLLFSLLGHRQRERFELERELDFAVTVSGKNRFRVNAHYQRNTVAVSMRLVPNSIPDFDSLGLPPVIRELAHRPHGLVLVTGPTGSGKSTTLATMIDTINQHRNCHIITIEDPIEFFHYNRVATIEQREVGADTHSFAAALKYILRQDPDVILVGEMRDVETISAAMTAAETGHLVLATLHTNDAPQTVDRIVDVFPPHQHAQVRAQLAASLLAIVSQRLLLRADGKGRLPAFEVLVATSAVRALVREGKTHQLLSTMETSMRDGMLTMDRCLADLLRAGRISLDEATRYVRNPQSLPKQEPFQRAGK